MTYYDVLIIGAGPAGLGAAHRLLTLQSTLSIGIIEARNRIGGRVFTSHKFGVPVDCGASWIHHYGPKNSLVPIALNALHKSVQKQKSSNHLNPLNSVDFPSPLISSSFPSVPKPFPSSHVPIAATALLPGYINEVNEDGTVLFPTSEHQGLGGSFGKMALFDHNGDVISARVYKKAVQKYNELFEAVEIDSNSLCNKLSQHLNDPSTNSSPLEDPNAPKDVNLRSLTSKQSYSVDFLRPSYQKWVSLQEKLDVPVESLLSKHFLSKASMTSEHSEDSTIDRVVEFLWGGTEQYEGSNSSAMSGMYWQAGSGDTDRDEYVGYGYGNLLNLIMQDVPCTVHLNNQVVSIDYSSSLVEVRTKSLDSQTDDTNIYRARYVVCALPLGVLKRNVVDFIPQLPKEKIHAITTMGCGVMNKIILKFNNSWWGEDIVTIGYCHPTRGTFRYFLSLKPTLMASGRSESESNILVCFVTGEFAKELEKQSDEQQIEGVMDVLRRCWSIDNGGVEMKETIVDPQFTEMKDGLNDDEEENKEYFYVHKRPVNTILNASTSHTISEPIDFEVTRWWNDPYSLGSYSHFALNTSLETVRMCGAHVANDKVGFAGEYTCMDNIGCADSAWESGEREANRIVAAMNPQ